ncbi:MAG: bile acid:sodium symporter [Candidatus Bathyarchaeia archaeon]
MRAEVSLVVILVGILLGFFLPQIGALLSPYLSYVLILLMFFSSLEIYPKKLFDFLRRPQLLLLSLLIVFILTPLLSLSVGFLNPITFAGVLLTLSTPPAVASAFWAKHLNGDLELALMIITVGSFLSVFTLPLTMFLVIGRVIQLNLISMVLDLSKLIFLPALLAFLFQRKFPQVTKKLVLHRFKISILLMLLILWGSISGGVQLIENVLELGMLTVLIFTLLVVALAGSYFLTRKFGKPQTVAIGIATTLRNGVLSIVVGTTAFGSQILPSLIGGILAQSIMLMLLQIVLKYSQ